MRLLHFDDTFFKSLTHLVLLIFNLKINENIKDFQSHAKSEMCKKYVKFDFLIGWQLK